jgi:hypothetical protein
MHNKDVPTLPSVFLSSTFFDLRQVRADLSEFVEGQMGYRLLASEHASFPVDPSIDTIENCRRRIEDDADLFVLVVGSRYGSVPEGHNRSVTNIEYLTARAKGVPIYVFVHRDILALLPVWEANPAADFSRLVDTNELFRFVSEVRASDRVWSFGFDLASDIVLALRTQFAYQMTTGLAVCRRLRNDPAEFRELEGQALRLSIDRPKGWPLLLLAELLEQQLANLADMRRDYDSGLTSGSGEVVLQASMGDWGKSNFEHVRRIIQELTYTLNETLNTACAKSDIAAIVYGSRRAIAAYRESLEWANRLRRAHVPEEVKAAIALLARFSDAVVLEVSDFPTRLREAVAGLIASGKTRGHVGLTFTVDPALTEGYIAEMRKATQEIERRSKTV